MWSVGVIGYFLLVGQNPFCTAVLKQAPEERDNEVMRLAALGKFNQMSTRWKRLDASTQNFLSELLQVKASMRPSPKEALGHPFFAEAGKGLKVGCSLSNSIHNQWVQFDGFQQLGWLAVARAVSDPELDMDVINSAMMQKSTADITETFDKSSYIYHLARELATSTIGKLLQQRTLWAEVLRLAFGYLDVDRDGVLSQYDLMLHFMGDHPGNHSGKGMVTDNDAWTLVLGSLEHWKTQQSNNNNNTQGLNYSSFCEVLLAC